RLKRRVDEGSRGDRRRRVILLRVAAAVATLVALGIGGYLIFRGSASHDLAVTESRKQSADSTMPLSDSASRVRSGATEINPATALTSQEKRKMGNHLKRSTEDVRKIPTSPAKKDIKQLSNSENRRDEDVAKSTEVAGVETMPESVRSKAAAKPLQLRTDSVHSFPGRITDKDGRPLPFATIRVINDSTASFSDRQGNFLLTMKDSTVKVKVTAVGYTASIARLEPMKNNNITLDPASAPLSEVVVVGYGRKKGLNGADSLWATPEGGWGKFYEYIQTQRVIPGPWKKSGKTGAVIVSFKIGEDGRPESIMIDHPLDVQCNREAIRLLEEGPDWKSNDNSGRRVHVSVSF
ncbi:MAG TPA: carboxypeptidase-like regulatory domain-containing protein, partial [Chitinophagaceae bacterium]